MGNTLRERKMYQEFVLYASARARSASRLNLDAPGDSATDPEEQAMRLGINAATVVELDRYLSTGPKIELNMWVQVNQTSLFQGPEGMRIAGFV